MISHIACNDCIHCPVCGKKDNYERAIKGMDNFFINTFDGCSYYLKDSKDISVNLRCVYYRKQTQTLKGDD